MTMYEFIAGEEGKHAISVTCRVLGVARSGFYAWKNHAPTARHIQRERFERLIRDIFVASDSTYGYRRVHAQLLRDGEQIDDDTVRVIMRDLGLEPCQPKPFRPTTTIAGDAATLPDLVRRDFTATAPGLRLVGDITYIRTWEGWVYLATVLDCFSKKVVGYAMDREVTANLVIQALDMAAGHVRLRPGISVFHSDRGTQGGFNRSSQHLERGGVWWRVRGSRGRSVRPVRGGSGPRTGRCGRRCVRRVVLSRRGRCSGSSGI